MPLLCFMLVSAKDPKLKIQNSKRDLHFEAMPAAIVSLSLDIDNTLGLRLRNCCGYTFRSYGKEADHHIQKQQRRL